MGIKINDIGGKVFNLTVFAAYCVFCGFYFKAEYPPEANVWLAVLVFAAILLAMRVAAAVIHQLGRLIFALAGGFKILYFEASFFKIWRDGSRGRRQTRFALFFEPRTFFGGTVFVRFKDRLDTPAAVNKNARKFVNQYLGGLAACAAVLTFVLVWGLCCSVFKRFAFTPWHFAAGISAWYMIYAALTETPARRGDFPAFLKNKDGENLALTLASQSVVENINHDCLFDEAANVVLFKEKNQIPWTDRFSMNALSNMALLAAADEYGLPDGVPELFAALWDAEKLKGRPQQERLLIVSRVRAFAAYHMSKGEFVRAKEIIMLAAETFAELYINDVQMRIYMRDILALLDAALGAETDAGQDEEINDLLDLTQFVVRDSYAFSFTYYRETVEKAEERIRTVILSAAKNPP